jgi:hypothetical protein
VGTISTKKMSFDSDFVGGGDSPTNLFSFDFLVGETAKVESDSGVQGKKGKRRRSKLESESKFEVHRIKVACVVCKIKKLGCDESRPCKKCVSKGVAHLCTDRPEVFDKEVLESTEKQVTKRKYKKRKSKDPVGGNIDLAVFVPRTLLTSLDKAAGLKRNFVQTVRDLYMEYHMQKSPFYFRDLILERTNAWRTMQTFMGIAFEKDCVEELRSEIVNAAVATTILDSEMSGLMEERVRCSQFAFHFGEPKVENDFGFSEETYGIIQRAFNVLDVYSADLAIFDMRFELLDRDTLQVGLQCNEHFETVCDRRISDFREYLQVFQTRKDLLPTPIAYFISQEFWREFAEFGIKSCLLELFVKTSKVTVINYRGDEIPCVVLMTAEADHSTSIRTRVSFCLRPVSLLFDLKL